MPRSKDFQKIYKRFIAQYGEDKGKSKYFSWIKVKGYDDTKPLPSKETKELICNIRGVEIKETELDYHLNGLVATSHIDNSDHNEGVDIPDMIPKETLESFATQINTNLRSRVMGLHHSEGKPINAEYYGVADIDNTPANVIQLNDGEWGLQVDTVLLKNDPKTPELINKFESGDLNAFSITYDTNGFLTTDFEQVGDNFVRILNPETRLFGYTAASNPVNPHAIATDYGFKEFKELVGKNNNDNREGVQMTNEEDKEKNTGTKNTEENAQTNEGAKEQANEQASTKTVEDNSDAETSETKEFQQWKDEKKVLEQKELLDNTATKIATGVLKQMEVKEKVLKDTDEKNAETKEITMEMKEFIEVVKDASKIEVKETFRRAAAVADSIGLDWRNSTTPQSESREYKSFGVNGRDLEFKGLGITTNQNTDTDYLQSGAELQDVYDPVIYNALNQETVLWNIIAKDDYSKKGNNQVQFALKIASNTTAAFYNGNSVATGNVTRLKYQTKFKKVQVGVAVDGDMIAAARGGPVSDVFAQEVMDSTMDMLSVINAALFDEVGLETAAAVIGLEYIADSAGNTTLYNLTRSSANKLSPASAGDTYINQASTIVSMTNLRALKRQATNEGAKKKNLVYVTNPVQGDLMRGKFDDARRMLTSKDTDFGFSTDLFVDGIPVFEDTDCNTDDWFLVDRETHRVGIWNPPTIERLGKSSDSEAAFIKAYIATYNRAPRRLGMIYGCATS